MALSDAKRCTGKAKSTGKQCTNPAMTGSTKCRHHGGATPSGVNSPHFKHGNSIRYKLPPELLTTYQDAIADPELHDQRASIALIDTMLASVLPGIETADAGVVWEQQKALVAKCRLAYQREDYPGLEAAVNAMDDLANRRLKHYASIDKAESLLDTRRKHVESTKKIELAGQRAITIEQLMLFVAQISHVFQMIVPDRQQQHAFALEIQQLVNLPAGTTEAE